MEKAPKKRKLTDRTLPPSLNDFAPESTALYQQLQEMERNLDWTMARKKIELQDALTPLKPMKVPRTLRVFLSHTVENQPWQGETTPNFETGQGIPSWTFKIQGRLLDSPVARHNKPPQRKFSSFLKSIVVEIDRDPTLFPSGNIVEWHNPHPTPAAAAAAAAAASHSGDQDGFLITKPGDGPLKLRVVMHLLHSPERYAVHPDLGSVLDLKEESRTGVLNAFWNYVKLNGLQDKVDRKLIRLDTRLQMVFQRESLLFQQIPEVIHRFLQPAESIRLHYNLQVDAESNSTPRIQAYDIPIDTDDISLKSKMQAVITNMTGDNAQQITALDEEIAQAAQSIRNAKLKHDFLTGFASDPRKFISTWFSSQSRDLDVMLGNERGIREEDLRKSEFFKMPWVNEAVAINEGVRMAGALNMSQAPAAR